MGATKRPRRMTSWALRLGIVVVCVPLGYVLWDQATYNFGTVERGRVYRSGQMPWQTLGRTIRDHQIKTVLNLRGSNRVDGWYRAEVTATNW